MSKVYVNQHQSLLLDNPERPRLPEVSYTDVALLLVTSLTSNEMAVMYRCHAGVRATEIRLEHSCMRAGL